jgi:hypothetical protein
MSARTSMLRAVYGGTETMRNKGKDFLPQYDRESDTRYASRLASTFALNKFREAVDAASAKPFRTLMQVKNTDPDLDLWLQDIDLIGNHAHIFAHQFFNNSLTDGMCHIMVDHPTTSNLPNLAAQQASGARPFWKLIKQGDLVAAYEEYTGGDTMVTHARIRSSRVERTADFKEIIWNQITVVEVEPGTTNGVAQLWESRGGAGGGSGGGWTFINETPINIAEVPLVTLYGGEKEGAFLAKSAFIDLAYKQIEHWISSSDQRSILAAGRFPMLACSGVEIDPEDEDSLAIGPWKILHSPDANGRWYFVEPKGSAIASGQKDLETLEMHMDMMALNPVTGTHRQYVPQNERDIQETRVHSVVHDLAISCQQSVEKAIRFMGMWTNKDYSQVTALLNTEFANTKDRLAEVTALVAMYEKKGISRATLLQEIKNRHMFDEDFDVEGEITKILAENAGSDPSAVTAGTQPGAPDPAAQASAGGTDPGATDFPKGQNRPTKQI